MFNCGYRVAQHAIQWKRVSSRHEEEVSWFFSCCSWKLGYILQLWWGWPFVSRVSSVKSGLLSSYSRHLRNLNLAWQNNTDASGREAGNQVSLSSWHSSMGIPINFKEE